MYELKYEQTTDRWHAIPKGGGRDYALHCGDMLTIQIEDQHYLCRLELDSDWYVIIGKTRFRLYWKEIYQVLRLL